MGEERFELEESDLFGDVEVVSGAGSSGRPRAAGFDMPEPRPVRYVASPPRAGLSGQTSISSDTDDGIRFDSDEDTAHGAVHAVRDGTCGVWC